MAISSRRDERFAAYAASQVRLEHPTAGALVVRPVTQGTVEGTFPEPAGVTIYVVTAHNPGRKLSAQANEGRHRRLLTEVSTMPDVTVWPAVGGDSDWVHTEEGVALTGASEDAVLALARRFDQEAVFAWDIRSFRVIDCDDGAVLTFGWTCNLWHGPRLRLCE